MYAWLFDDPSGTILHVLYKKTMVDSDQIDYVLKQALYRRNLRMLLTEELIFQVLACLILIFEVQKTRHCSFQDTGIVLTDEEYATITVQLDREMTGIINYK